MKLKKIISGVAAAAVMLSGLVFPEHNEKISFAAAQKSRVSVHDPSIFKADDGTYYVFGSHIDAAKSTDLQNWKLFTNGYATSNNAIFGDLSGNLAGAFSWAGENLEDCEGGFAVWAPDVIYNPDYVNKDGSKGAYLMYFCTSSTYMRSVIAYAASKKVEGPYEFVDTLIYSGFTKNDSFATSSTKNVNRKYTSTNVDELIADGKVTWNDSWFRGDNFNNQLFPNAIDPTIYYSPDGKMYLTYGSWSGGIFMYEVDKKTGNIIRPKTGTTSDGRMVDSYFGTKISGGYGKSGEGPFIEYNADTGYYYLWVTYGGLFSDGGYNMRVFRSRKPDGPFVDAAGNPAVLSSTSNLDSVGLKVMGNYKFSSLNRAYMACGHNSVLRDDDGKWYLFNHARFDDGSEYHEVRVHSMYFNSEDWPVVAPYEYSGDELSEGGYNTSDIVGDYEFIDHGIDTGKTIHNYVGIKFNADGSISGGATGTWSEESGSANASFVIGGQRYDGCFLAVQDETGTGKRVMSFMAVGNNNHTVWGVQTKEYTGTDRSPLGDYSSADSSLVYAPDTITGTNGVKNISGTDLLSGISYFIENKNSGLLMEAKSGLTAEGTNIQQWEMNKGPHHEWRITDLGNGYCRISLMSNESMALTVDGSTDADGLNIMLSKYNGNENQQWKLIKDGSCYGIVSRSSKDTAGLDVYEWSTENGGNINQWNYWGGDCQLWKLTPVRPAVNEGIYTLRNVNSSKYISADGVNVIQASDAKAWKIKSSGDGTYSVIDGNGKALTVEGGTADDGNNVSLSEYKEAASQKFRVICNKDGSYSLLSEVSDGRSCLDVYEVSMDDGANICQWDFWGGDGQKFVLEPAAELNASEELIGDVNADGKFDIADLVMLQKYVLGSGILTDWRAGDLCKDGVIDSFDTAMMRRELISRAQKRPTEALKIYAVGDSITYGYLSPEYAYPLELGKLMTEGGFRLENDTIINYGGNSREISEFDTNTTDADVILLMGGTNDVHQSDAIKSSDHDAVYNSIKTDLTSLIADLRKNSGGSPVIFLGTIPYFNLYEENSDGKTGRVTDGGSWWWNMADHGVMAYSDVELSKLRAWDKECRSIVDAANEAVRDIAESDSFIRLVDINSVITPGLLQKDGCHPNQNGWKKIAEAFYSAINIYYSFK